MGVNSTRVDRPQRMTSPLVEDGLSAWTTTKSPLEDERSRVSPQRTQRSAKQLNARFLCLSGTIAMLVSLFQSLPCVSHDQTSACRLFLTVASRTSCLVVSYNIILFFHFIFRLSSLVEVFGVRQLWCRASKQLGYLCRRPCYCFFLLYNRIANFTDSQSDLHGESQTGTQ